MKRGPIPALLVCLVFIACKPQSTPTATPTATPMPVAGKAASDVLLHVGPDLDDDEMGSLAAGEQVQILSRTPDWRWFLIRLSSGERAWVSAAYISLDSAAVVPTVGPGDHRLTLTPTPRPTNTVTPTPTPTPTPTAVPTPIYLGYLPLILKNYPLGSTPSAVGTATGNVHLRAGPGTDYDQVSLLSAGEQCAIYGQTADGAWFKVLLTSGDWAWASAEYIWINIDVEAIPTVIPAE